MRQKIWFIFAIIFAVNTVSLSAYANVCQMNMQSNVASMQSVDSDMPPCHEKMAKSDEASSGHCEGVCFCNHVLLNAPLLLHSGLDILVDFQMSKSVLERDYLYNSLQTSPLYRPPISLLS